MPACPAAPPFLLGAATRALRLFLLGVGTRLDPLPHLLLHTACLALAASTLGTYCTQPMFASPLMEGRLSVLHMVMSIPLAAIMPPGHPEGGQRVQCVAASLHACILLGWLLPTALVVRTRWQAMGGRPAPVGLHGNSSSSNSVPAGNSGGSNSSGRHSGGGSSGDGSGAGEQHLQQQQQGEQQLQQRQGEAQTRSFACLPSLQDRAVGAAMEWVFLEGAPGELQATAWCILSVMAWLVATLLAGLVS